MPQQDEQVKWWQILAFILFMVIITLAVAPHLKKDRLIKKRLAKPTISDAHADIDVLTAQKIRDNAPD